MENRDFKGIWIPKEIWLDKRLNALEKVILMEIDSLDVDDGCYASNQYLAEFCGCSETKVSLTISKLIDNGFLYVESFDGRTRILKSRLSKNERQTFTNSKADSQKMKESNNSLDKEMSNYNKKEISKEKKSRFVKPTIEQLKEYCEERKNNVDYQKFYYHYESNGWKVGKNSMKDWKATIRTWERSKFNNNNNSIKKENSEYKNIIKEQKFEYDFNDDDLDF